MLCGSDDPAGRSAYQDNQAYFDLYDELARKYPESEIVHNYRGPGSRYWTILSELRPFAERSAYLLDVGCNDGIYTVPFCRVGGRAVGIDISPTLIGRAAQHALQAGVSCEFVPADIESSDVVRDLDDPFDVVLFSEVLEHLRNPNQAIANIMELLKEGGHLLLSTPTAYGELGSRIMPRVIWNTLSHRKLLEQNVLHTRDVDVLRAYNVSSFSFRHDGYYPRALRRYIQSFGFRLVSAYTIGFRKPVILVGPSLRPFQVLRSDNPRMAADLILRRVPVVRLLGSTNVALFQKAENEINESRQGPVEGARRRPHRSRS